MYYSDFCVHIDSYHGFIEMLAIVVGNIYNKIKAEAKYVSVQEYANINRLICKLGQLQDLRKTIIFLYDIWQHVILAENNHD